MSAFLAARRHLTDLGLEGIRDVPYGAHLCRFYEDRRDLAQTLVPYFLAGLSAGERCLWITADPLGREDAEGALAEAGVDCAAQARRGALLIRDHAAWYGEDGVHDHAAIVQAWLDEEQRALRGGFDGLRITGNPSFVSAENWADLVEYEALFHAAARDRRIVALCTYPCAGLSATQALEVVERHTCALDHPDEGWQIVLKDTA